MNVLYGDGIRDDTYALQALVSGAEVVLETGEPITLQEICESRLTCRTSRPIELTSSTLIHGVLWRLDGPHFIWNFGGARGEDEE